MKDYYRILQVSPEADAAEIKKSFRRLATLYHPDKNADPSANQLFQELNEAYQIIGDSQQRQWYDMQLLYPDLEPAPYTPPPQPRRPPAAYRAQQRVYIDLRPYVVFSKVILWISLAFCMTLTVDYFLPRSVLEEPVLGVRIIHQTGRVEVSTPRRVVSMAMQEKFMIDLSKYTPILIYKTPMFESAVKAELNGIYVRIDNNIYSYLIFFPILLLILSVLGLLSKNNEMIVNFGIASSIILIITSFLIFLVLRL